MLKTNGTIAVSEFINDHINNCYPTKNNNIRTIARGVDLDFFDPNNCKTQQVELIIKKFNIDNDQRFDYKGLPSPANALFVMAFPLLIEHPFFSSIKPLLLSYWALFILTLVSSLLMNLRLPLFSFKIKTLNIKDYRYQIFIIISSLPAFYFLDWAAVPLIILIYLILNFLKNSIT